MIEINLLPKELRKKKIEIPEIDISFLPIAAVFLGLIIVIHSALSLSVALKTRSLNRLNERWQEKLPEEEKAVEYTNKLTDMRTKIDAIDSLLQGRMSWTEKLNNLGDAMIPGVWLNSLWLERRMILQKAEENAEPTKVMVKTLHLKGSVIVTGEETAAIGKFIRSLKENERFFADFKEIGSASIQRSRLKDVEVMDFELICYFK